jgi:hypothetical protein
MTATKSISRISDLTFCIEPDHLSAVAERPEQDTHRDVFYQDRILTPHLESYKEIMTVAIHDQISATLLQIYPSHFFVR